MADLQANLQSWWTSVVQAKEANDDALEKFYLACDKEVATKAAYKALGIDPMLAPTFNNPSRVMETTTISNNNNSMLPVALTAAVFGVSGLAAGKYLLDSPNTNPPIVTTDSQVPEPSHPTVTAPPSVDNPSVDNPSVDTNELRDKLCKEIANNPELKQKVQDLVKSLTE